METEEIPKTSENTTKSDSELQFAPFLFKSFQEVALQLKHNKELTTGFIAFLFDLIEEKCSLSVGVFSIPKIDIRILLTWCTWILSLGEQPDAFLKELKSKSTSIVCTKVWNDGYYFYRCRDCERSPSSSICSECFSAGDHKGHDFIFERSVYGGCCDCGNSLAWKPSGFCPTHTGTFSEDPSHSLPPLLRETVDTILSVLMIRLSAHFPTSEKPLDSKSAEIVSSTINWIRYIGSFSEGILSIIRKKLTSDITSPNPIKQLLSSCVHLKGAILDDVLFLFLDALQDPSFKEKFMEYYIQDYPQLLQHMLKTKDINVIYKISPQLFTISGLTIPAVKNLGLLDMMLKNVLNLFEQLSVVHQPTGLKIIDCDNSLMSPHNYYAFTNDLNNLLSESAVAQYIAYEREDLLKMFVEIISLAQGTNPLIRKTDVHTEYESITWKSSFSLEVELSRSIVAIAEGFCADHNKSDETLLLRTIKKIIHTFSEAQFKWISSLHMNMMPWRDKEIVEYDVACQPVSFHIPLNRAIARFLSEAVQIFPELEIDKILPLSELPKQFPALLMEQPLHLHVLMSQARADMWIRNGYSIQNQLYVYRGCYFMESYHSDILLLQCGIVLLGPELFFETSLRRFGLKEWFRLYSVAPDVKEASRAEDFFRFIIMMVSERTRIGLSTADVVRREIIHLLAVDGFTRSKLTSELNQKLLEHRDFESILLDVADYKQPSSNSPGTYSLKTKCWKEFDPFFSRYEAPTRQSALERFAPHKPKTQPVLTLPKTFTGFSSVISLLHQPALHHLYYVILSNSILHPTTFEAVLRCCLHLILLTIDNRQEYSSSTCSNPTEYYTTNDLIVNCRQFIPLTVSDTADNKENKEPSNESILSLLIKMYEDTKFKEQRDYVTPILQRLFTLDATCQQLIHKYLPEFQKEDDSEKKAQEAIELRRQQARARQRAILEQFAKQQSAFLQENKEAEEPDSSGAQTASSSDDYETISTGSLCALCRSEAPLSEGRVLGYVCLIQPSRVLLTAKKQDMGIDQSKRSIQSNQKMEEKHPSFVLSSSPVQKEEEMLQQQQEEGPNGIDIQELSGVEEEFKGSDVGEFGDSFMCRNLDNCTGTSVHLCGHRIHDDCFYNFFKIQVDNYNANPLYMRISAPNVDKGEFLCPVCRRLSNALIPLIPTDLLPTNTLSQPMDAAVNTEEFYTELKEFMGAKSTQAQTSEQPTQHALMIDREIQDLAKRIYCAQSYTSFLSNPLLLLENSTPALWDSIISTVGLMEVILRHKDELIAELHSQFSCCESMIRCTAMQLKSGGQHYLLHLSKIIRGEKCNFITETEVLPCSPLLSVDMFGMLVRMALLSPETTSPQKLKFITRLLFSGLVVQALSRIALSKGEEDEGPKEESKDNIWLLYSHLCKTFEVTQRIHSVEKLKGMMMPMCLPFLRRANLFLRVFRGAHNHSGAVTVSNSQLNLSDDFEELRKELGLPTLEQLMEGTQENPLNSLIQKWIDQLLGITGNKRKQTLKYIPRLAAPTATKLIDLPHTFQELILKFIGVKCTNCGTVPKQAALCLICGAICCVASKCCFSKRKKRAECSVHSRECGGGVFLLLKSTYVLILREERSSGWSSLYLDEHGEEDPNLRRGKPLYLSTSRYNELRKLWLFSSFDHDTRVLNSTSREGFFM